MAALIPFLGWVLTAAVTCFLIVRGDSRQERLLLAVLLTMGTGAAVSGAAYVVLGQKMSVTGPWVPGHVIRAFGGMTSAVFAALAAVFLPVVVVQRDEGPLVLALSLGASLLLLMFGFLCWLGAVSW